MRGAVEYITPNLNEQEWIFDYTKSGLIFEEFMYDFIAYILRPLYSKGLSIEKTANTRDGGKDIIIISPIDFQLFGIDFKVRHNKKILIYIECKSSQKDKISLEKISKNILLANGKKIDYFVLLTNTTIVPHAYYEVEKNAEKNGYFFHLVDQLMIADFLTKNNANIGKYTFPEKIDEISLSYQINKGRMDGKPCFDMYLLFRNNTVKPCICRFKLKSDRNWKLSENEFDFMLDGHSGRCKKINIQKQYFDGLDDILLSFDLNTVQKSVEICGTSLQYTFEPPLFGEHHNQIINKIFEECLSNTSLKSYNLHGEAGIGKTRIIDEIYKKIISTDVKPISFRCKKREGESNLSAFKDCLQKEIPIEQDGMLGQKLSTLHVPYKRYLIIIEDIHYAEKDFFEELRSLSNLNNLENPITIITAGRDDYSVFNEKYIDYLEWIKKYDNDNFSQTKIHPLKPLECRNMIIAIINGAPEVVVERIQEKSRNNPFYIVQFIEYLLETELIYLVNRNTTGISNVATFNQKIYIPNKIEELLEQRFNVLMKNNGEHVVILLLFLGYVGIETPKWFITKFADYLEIEQIDFLFERHFLTFSKNGNVMFDHETIYLFVQKKLENTKCCKKICQAIYKNKEIFEELSDLKKGKAFFYMNKFDEAEKCFSLPLNQIRTMHNISAENLEVTYVDYLNILYQLFHKKGNEELQKNILLAWTYLIIHNISMGKAAVALAEIQNLSKENHSSDQQFRSKISQLQAHYFMQCGMMSQAKRLSQELIAQERTYPFYFDDQTRFNLFDRVSSIYIQSNHMLPAIQYNKLSMEIAKKLEDGKLKTLAVITRAKIYFFQEPVKAYMDLKYAKKLLKDNMVIRINCHNELSIVTIKLLTGDSDIQELISDTQELLINSLKINYPVSQIRCYYLLAVMHYLNNNIVISKEYLSKALETSTQYGIIKLMASIYNMKAIIATYENEKNEDIRKYYNTMLQYMRQQDQLFLGSLDFCYSNIINLTNYAIFLNNIEIESEMYKFLGEITYYGSDIQCDFDCRDNKTCFYTCKRNVDIFKQNLKSLKDGQLLFLDQKYKYNFYDKKTCYYIPLGI